MKKLLLALLLLCSTAFAEAPKLPYCWLDPRVGTYQLLGSNTLDNPEHRCRIITQEQIKDPGFCGLSPLETGKWDIYWQTGVCPAHDKAFNDVIQGIDDGKTAWSVTWNFVTGATTTFLESLYGVAAFPFYILIGGLGGFVRYQYLKNKKLQLQVDYWCDRYQTMDQMYVATSMSLNEYKQLFERKNTVLMDEIRKKEFLAKHTEKGDQTTFAVRTEDIAEALGVKL